jgi:ferric citrate transport system permease protein
MTLAQRPDQAGGGAPHPAGAGAPPTRARNRDVAVFIPLVLIALSLLVRGAAWSLSVGTRSVSIQAILTALFAPDSSSTTALVRDIRLPRVVLAVAVGANIAIAGVVMQGITGNPLGAPDILGVSAGAALVVVAVVLFTQVAGFALIMLAFLGAGVSAVLVLGVAGARQKRISAVRLALAGITVTAVQLSLTQAIIIFHPDRYRRHLLLARGWRQPGTVGRPDIACAGDSHRLVGCDRPGIAAEPSGAR